MTKYVEKVVNDIIAWCIWRVFMLFVIIWILVHRND